MDGQIPMSIQTEQTGFKGDMKLLGGMGWIWENLKEEWEWIWSKYTVFLCEILK